MLTLINHDAILDLVSLRNFEKKIGEGIITGSINELAKKGVKFVLFGVQESVGIKANFGTSGTENAWDSFLKSFVNIQENQFIDVTKIGVLGSLRYNVGNRNLDALRLQTSKIDKEVESIVKEITSHRMIPILIGGGHNNAYPLLTGSCKGYGETLNAINCDPHADFRPIEGRHSGNGFTYAMNEEVLDRYFILGLHQNYNGKSIFNEFKKANKSTEKVKWTFFDEWIYGNSTMEKDLEIGIQFVKNKRVGIELDMDAINYMPSSASGPSGIQLYSAREYVSKCASALNVAYLHLAEAAPISEYENKMVGKSLTYLVTDFIKNT